MALEEVEHLIGQPHRVRVGPKIRQDLVDVALVI
jgi:hypothetical protein